MITGWGKPTRFLGVTQSIKGKVMNEQKFELVPTGLYTGRGEPVMKKVRIIRKRLRMRDENRSSEEHRKRKSLAKAKRARKAQLRGLNHLKGIENDKKVI